MELLRRKGEEDGEDGFIGRSLYRAVGSCPSARRNDGRSLWTEVEIINKNELNFFS